MLIRFLAKHKKGRSAHAIRLNKPLSSIEIKDKRKKTHAENVRWIVIDEQDDEHFYTEEEFRQSYQIESAAISCKPYCTHLHLYQSSEDWCVLSTQSFYRCTECGSWHSVVRS